MKNITFEDKFRSKFNVIDYEHEKLFIYINNLIDAYNSPEIGALLIEINLDNLIKYAHFHFQTEEEMMQEAAYPDFLTHKKAHGIFLDSVQQFKTKYEQNELNLVEVIEYLTNWLTSHILTLDKKYDESFIKAGLDKKLM